MSMVYCTFLNIFPCSIVDITDTGNPIISGTVRIVVGKPGGNPIRGKH